MTDFTADDARFPVGPFRLARPPTPQERTDLVAELAALPARLRAVADTLTEAQLDTPYRPGGWTARQVVHHLPDSHLNAYVRVKLALTEERPMIRPYDEGAWAALPDAFGPVEPSLRLLSALHDRWAALWRALPEGVWARTYHHPESGEDVRLDTVLALYVWHGRHHLGHVERVRRQ